MQDGGLLIPNTDHLRYKGGNPPSLFPHRMVPWGTRSTYPKSRKKRTILRRLNRETVVGGKKKAESRMCTHVDARHFFWSEDIVYFQAQTRRRHVCTRSHVRRTPTTKRTPFTEEDTYLRQHPQIAASTPNPQSPQLRSSATKKDPKNTACVPNKNSPATHTEKCRGIAGLSGCILGGRAGVWCAVGWYLQLGGGEALGW